MYYIFIKIISYIILYIQRNIVGIWLTHKKTDK